MMLCCAKFHLQVSDVLERDGYGSTLSNGQLAVTIECGGSGFLKIGPALDALEDQAEGLGAAFYWTLVTMSLPLFRHISIPVPHGCRHLCMPH